jgi:hypothetical protein
MDNTTSINDLPSDPSVGTNNTVVLQTNDKKVAFDANNANSQQMNTVTNDMNSINSQKVMNEVVTGIQQASMSGSTALPSRDIPINTQPMMNDQEIQPNYIPNENNTDYIKNYETENDYIQNNMVYTNRKDSLEYLYEELQIPILIGLLFFIMQLPVVKSHLIKVIPGLFSADGNPNLTGYIVNSVLFSMIFYILFKFLNNN